MKRTVRGTMYMQKCVIIPIPLRRMLSTQFQEGISKSTNNPHPENYNEMQKWKDENNNDVLFQNVGDNGLITLNRPNALNALTMPMCKRITKTLHNWKYQKKLVVIEGTGDKAFCAGGDLKLLKYAYFPNVDVLKREYFGTLNTLFHLIGTYNIPYIALMNNITMGNGSGLSIHAKYRIVTERSIFAMPEVTIGYYPDGGCSFVFPRLQGQLGLFLGLTGYRLKGIDILLAGIATHYVPTQQLQELKNDLLMSKSSDIEEIIKNYQIHDSVDTFSLAPYMDKINEYFSAPTIEEIIERLEADRSDWAKKVLKMLSKMSPTSLKVTQEVFRRGRKLSFTDCIKMEFRVSCSFVSPDSDFVKAALSKNGIPLWNPSTLNAIKTKDTLQRFNELEPDKELRFE